MKERPILFSGAMVRALLAGTKTQTRRVLKVQPPPETVEFCTYHHPDPRLHHWATGPDALLDFALPCPYGQPGDQLYVRETWQHANHPHGPVEPGCPIFYRADYLDDQLGPDLEHSADGIRRKWVPSIHMPRWASRITLEVTNVRVERLQGISEADARAEGVVELPGQAAERGAWWTADTGAGSRLHGRTPAAAYRLLWESINGADSWAANPWVWIVEFKRITP